MIFSSADQKDRFIAESFEDLSAMYQRAFAFPLESINWEILKFEKAQEENIKYTLSLHSARGTRMKTFNRHTDRKYFPMSYEIDRWIHLVRSSYDSRARPLPKMLGGI